MRRRLTALVQLEFYISARGVVSFYENADGSLETEQNITTKKTERAIPDILAF